MGMIFSIIVLLVWAWITVTISFSAEMTSAILRQFGQHDKSMALSALSVSTLVMGVVTIWFAIQ